MTFESFLEEKCIDEREFDGLAITKDNFEHIFPLWLNELDPQEFIDYAEEWKLI